MDATAQKLMADLRAKKFAPVYFLQGEETFYIDLLSSYIENNVLDPSERSFNQVIVYGKDSPVNVILTHAKRFPMMAERQVVIVREAQDIPDLQKETGTRLLLDYFQRPVPSTVLVFCHMHKNLDKRKELGKKAESLVSVATFKKVYENQLPAFVEEYVSSKGFKIEDQAVRVLCESVGNDLSRLANEIDKVLIALQPGARVSAEVVMSQVGISREYNIFELQKALILRDNLQAARIVNYFEANTRKNPAIPMVAFLYSFFSKLMVASAARISNEKEIVSVLKISPFAARDYSTALRQFPLQRIIENIGHLREADGKLKGVNSGSSAEGDVLKELVIRLML
jgi:DNA polymerase-3 subunit delta